MDTIWIVVIACAAVIVLAIVIAIIANALKKNVISFKTGKVRFTGEIPPIRARKGKAVTLPALTSSYYDFKGWYYDAACKQKADIAKMPKKDVVLHAGWEKKPVPKPEVVSEPTMDLGGAIAHNLSFKIALDW